MVVFCSVLFYSISLYLTVLCFILVFVLHSVLLSSVIHSTLSHSNLLYSTLFYYTNQCCCILLCSTLFYCTTLNYSVPFMFNFTLCSTYYTVFLSTALLPTALNVELWDVSELLSSLRERERERERRIETERDKGGENVWERSIRENAAMDRGLCVFIAVSLTTQSCVFT